MSVNFAKFFSEHVLSIYVKCSGNEAHLVFLDCLSVFNIEKQVYVDAPIIIL